MLYRPMYRLRCMEERIVEIERRLPGINKTLKRRLAGPPGRDLCDGRSERVPVVALAVSASASPAV